MSIERKNGMQARGKPGTGFYEGSTFVLKQIKEDEGGDYVPPGTWVWYLKEIGFKPRSGLWWPDNIMRTLLEVIDYQDNPFKGFISESVEK